MGAELKGYLRVGTLNSMGVQLMSPIVSRLLKYNPQLNVKIEYGKGDDLIRIFKKGLLDVLILPDVETQFGMDLGEVEKQFLLKEEMWLVGTGKDVEIPKQIGIDEYGRYPVILFSGEFPDFNNKLEQALTTSSTKVTPTFESTNVGTLKRVIESGLGWGFLPSLSIKKQVKMGRLTHVHVKGLKYETEFYYYSRKDQALKSITDVFYQALLQQERG
jgi:LysR family transcriptional regulator, transcriptional activator of the cysJI operon